MPGPGLTQRLRPKPAGRWAGGLVPQHLGHPIPSPAIFARIGDRFRAAVSRYADGEHIPVVRFGKDDRKLDVMRPYLADAERGDRPGGWWRSGWRRSPGGDG
jgi:hypothetical protein